MKFFCFPGWSDCDDHQAGGEQQEEGRQVLAKLWYCEAVQWGCQSKYPGTYIHRRLHVCTLQLSAAVVEQLQCDSWPDRTAPDDTKVAITDIQGDQGHYVQILLDLVYKVQELNPDYRRPILVHCSAGVGRTGTFIALYKLVIDYQDPRRTNLSVFETVLHLRRFVSRLFIYVVSFFSFSVVAA